MKKLRFLGLIVAAFAAVNIFRKKSKQTDASDTGSIPA
jgi:hypothetical protein